MQKKISDYFEQKKEDDQMLVQARIPRELGERAMALLRDQTSKATWTKLISGCLKFYVEQAEKKGPVK